METIGDRINARRRELRISQRDLAKKMGVVESAISHWQKDTYIPDSQNLLKLAICLQVTPDWILTGKGIKSDSSETAKAAGDEVAKLHDDFLKLSPQHRRAVLSLAQALAEAQAQETNE